MAHRPNEEKGIKPATNAIAYQRELPNGDIEVATVLAYRIDARGMFQAWVHHPVYGTEMMTEKEGRLGGFTPIVALTEADIPRLAEVVSKALGIAAGVAPVLEGAPMTDATLRARVDDLEGTVAQLRRDFAEMREALGKTGRTFERRLDAHEKSATAHTKGATKATTDTRGGEAASPPAGPPASSSDPVAGDDLDFLNEGG